MPEWLFEKKDIQKTPSGRHGLDYNIECRYRKEGSRFISDVGADLNLKHDTVASGCVYYHRFFMFHSFKDFNRYVTALGCLFLAGKVEETPKKCRDIIRAARQRLNDEQFSAFGEDPREELMTIERVLLQTIKFDLQVDHPYQYLLRYAKILKGDQEKIQKMVQMAWTFINDSFCTTLCLQWEPEIIAIALMYLASRLSKFSIDDWQGRNANKSNEKWWDQFVEDMSMELLEDICHQVLDLYSNTGKEKNQQQKLAAPHGVAIAASSNSTPSPGGGPTKTPTVTTPGAPTAGPSFASATTPSTPSVGKLSIHPPLPPTCAPPTPGTPHPQMHVPPPPSTSMGQPAYAYQIPFLPPPPGSIQPQPPMPYGHPGLVYASYYPAPPPTTGGNSSAPMAPAYAVPAGYGYEYRPPLPGTPQPPQQPTYAAPATVPHAYMGMGHPHHMHHPPPGYPPPPPGHPQQPPLPGQNHRLLQAHRR